MLRIVTFLVCSFLCGTSIAGNGVMPFEAENAHIAIIQDRAGGPPVNATVWLQERDLLLRHKLRTIVQEQGYPCVQVTQFMSQREKISAHCGREGTRYLMTVARQTTHGFQATPLP